jgi:hypothetical protein
VSAAVVELPAGEREVAADEARVVLGATADEAQRERLRALVRALEDGVILPEHARLLEQIVSLGLQTGRIRAHYGPGGEQAALRLHRRLPGGIEGQRAAREVSEALAALHGRPLESITIAEVGPGAFSLAVSAGGAQLLVRLDRQGARLHSLEV